MGSGSPGLWGQGGGRGMGETEKKRVDKQPRPALLPEVPLALGDTGEALGLWQPRPSCCLHQPAGMPPRPMVALFVHPAKYLRITPDSSFPERPHSISCQVIFILLSYKGSSPCLFKAPHHCYCLIHTLPVFHLSPEFSHGLVFPPSSLPPLTPTSNIFFY